MCSSDLAAALTLCTTLGYFCSFYESKQFITRSSGVSLEEALMHPFSFQSLISIILPFSVTAPTHFFNSDVSMINGYFGFIPFLFIILLFVNKNLKKHLNWILIIIVSLLIAAGDQTPFRTFLYNYIPGMNQFRYPSIFRYFFIGGCIILFSKSFLEFKNEHIKKLQIILTVALICISSATILATIGSEWNWVSSIESIYEIYSFSSLAKR